VSSIPSVGVHLYPTTLVNESRLFRMARTLVRGGVVSESWLVGVSGDGLASDERPEAGIRTIRLPRPYNPPKGLWQRLVNTTVWTSRVASRLEGVRSLYVHAHSLPVLPLAARLARRAGARLVYEPHELETETAGSKGLRRVAARLTERHFVTRADLIITVSETIAEWYRTTYGRPDIAVVRNIPSGMQSHAHPRGPRLRERLGIADDAIVFLYQGGLWPNRLIDVYLTAFRDMPLQCHLVFMGAGELAPMIREASRKTPRIHYLPAVPPAEVLDFTCGADVGLCGVDPVCLSYRYSLPNKIFEYLAAGVPFVAYPLPELVRLVDRYGCGDIVEGPDQLRAFMKGLNAHWLTAARDGVARACRDLTADAEAAHLLALYDRLPDPSSRLN
jgi:glycosyltransferase involved in cell wall biosynthesis